MAQPEVKSVSVYGDSAGGLIALAAGQELVRRGDRAPSRMVSNSPLLDATLSNPEIAHSDDRMLSIKGPVSSGRAT